MASLTSVRYVPGVGVIVEVSAYTTEAWTVQAPDGAVLEGAGPQVVCDPRAPYGVGRRYTVGGSTRQVTVPRMWDTSVVRLVPSTGGPGVEAMLADTRAKQSYTPRVQEYLAPGGMPVYGWQGPTAPPVHLVRLMVPAAEWPRLERILGHAGPLWWTRGGAVPVPGVPLSGHVVVTGRVTAHMSGHGSQAVMVVECEMQFMAPPVGSVAVSPWTWADLGPTWTGDRPFAHVPIQPQAGGAL